MKVSQSVVVALREWVIGCTVQLCCTMTTKKTFLFPSQIVRILWIAMMPERHKLGLTGIVTMVGVQVSSQSYAAFRFATNPKRYLNWCCTMSLGVSWFWPSIDFQVLRCDAMKIWCCTASSFSDVSPWPAKMLSPSSPPPGPRLCWGPHPGHWTQCPAPGCGPGRPAGQGVKQSSPTIKC